MNKASIAIALIGLIIIGALFLSKNHGFTARVDQASPESVAAAYTAFFSQVGEAGFFNRPDRAAYELLTLESKEAVDNLSGPLKLKLVEWSKSEAPFTLDLVDVEENGDQAQVDLIWHYGDGTSMAKTAYLSKLDGKWYIYSIINNQ